MSFDTQKKKLQEVGIKVKQGVYTWDEAAKEYNKATN